MEQHEVCPMKTLLYDQHLKLGAKIVTFSGWEMPLQYTGIIDEHHAVRNGVGIFDVSHMGRISIKGPDAENFADFLSTNTIAGKKEGSATYTVWCDSDGGAIDDVIVYKQSPSELFVIVNAGNRDADLLHVQNQASKFDVAVEAHYSDEGILAIQGPASADLMRTLFPESASLKPFRFMQTAFNGEQLILSRTGYTGENGFEIYAPLNAIASLWNILLQEGKKFAIQPIGLGARDTLRLEMGYALYGHELSRSIAATESISAWTVKLDKPRFLGKEALLALESSPLKRTAYGICLKEKGIAREGCPIFLGEQEIGVVTSGGYSPSLNQAIGLILIRGSFDQGKELHIEIRGKRYLAVIVPLPFFSNKEK